MSAEETAKALTLSPRTLASLTSAGCIPSFTVGRRRLYGVDALRAWVAEQTAKGGRHGD
ncbi:MAG: helix-turn-helix domain-containing protein [Phycisphaerales bacterium]|nr:helix-turn-helix domain-containing protein [Phycisphaerales bacterium]